mgnify:FL=1
MSHLKKEIYLAGGCFWGEIKYTVQNIETMSEI